MAHITASRNVQWKGAPMRTQKWADKVRSFSNKIPAQITCHNVIPGIYQCVLYFFPINWIRLISNAWCIRRFVWWIYNCHACYFVCAISPAWNSPYSENGRETEAEAKKWLLAFGSALCTFSTKHNSSANVAQLKHRTPDKKPPNKTNHMFLVDWVWRNLRKS